MMREYGLRELYKEGFENLNLRFYQVCFHAQIHKANQNKQALVSLSLSLFTSLSLSLDLSLSLS